MENKPVVGNVLVTTRDIKATEIILEEHPAALGCEILGVFPLVPVLDRRPKVYGRSRRFKTYGYGYGGRSLRPFLRPKVKL